MTKKRKHRVVVEVTTNMPLAEREVVHALQFMLNAVDLGAKPFWFGSYYKDVYAEKLITKQFSHVFAAETLQRKRRVWLTQKYAGGKFNTLNRS